MPDRVGRAKRISIFLVSAVLLAQLACGGGGSESSDRNSLNSNAANRTNAANANPKNSAAGGGDISSNQGGRTSNAPVIVGDGGGGGGTYPVSPDAPGNNPYPAAGGGDNRLHVQSQNMPPNFPGAQGQNDYPGGGGGGESPGETKSKPATPVMVDLEVAIDRWSDAEAAGYGLKMTLVTLWRRRNPTVKYNPVGIDSLTSRIKERPAFVNCGRAQKLSRDMFHDDGIKTVGHLYDYLEPCGGYANFK